METAVTAGMGTAVAVTELTVDIDDRAVIKLLWNER